jgi:hypothetical protein
MRQGHASPSRLPRRAMTIQSFRVSSGLSDVWGKAATTAGESERLRDLEFDHKLEFRSAAGREDRRSSRHMRQM